MSDDAWAAFAERLAHEINARFDAASARYAEREMFALIIERLDREIEMASWLSAFPMQWPRT